ncbi:hypothetical protein PGT21_007210 [Puccinia graminis f. sp. tritici]|uniref:Uncharacterized protein n=1 Tax=Puccinia graminis f. sp. tritici TaxID=56615 RepID=A0A5B0MBF0_PUCGR|nr:hypothetical protein PGTUg99_027709 [Puccinia graminis f. sp. tritici]KAA1090620.1 hypothetical protein PGT21_007210 [Puccinia graminis f. sp. tritici]
MSQRLSVLPNMTTKITNSAQLRNLTPALGKLLGVQSSLLDRADEHCSASEQHKENLEKSSIMENL